MSKLTSTVRKLKLILIKNENGATTSYLKVIISRVVEALKVILVVLVVNLHLID